jgi:hypothetical protein
MRMLLVMASCGALLSACGESDDLAAWQQSERKAPTITSVATTDGFTQICQSCTADLVVVGDGLSSARTVVLAAAFSTNPIATTILRKSNHQLLVRVVVPHGASQSAHDLVIRGSNGETVKPAAIEITPIVISPSASPTGGGTFQSPMLLCDPRVEQVGTFDTLWLLEGTHTCDRVLHLAPTVVVVGQGAGITRVVGTGSGVRLDFDGDNPSGLTVVGNLTFEGAIDGSSIRLRGDSALLVQNVDDRGGIVVTDGQQVFIEGYRFDGPGRAIVVDSNTNVVISNTTIRNCSEGIVVDVTRSGGAARAAPQITASTIEHCELGIQIGRLPQTPNAEHLLSTFVQDVQLIDNAVGILIQDGESVITDTTIRDDETTPATVTTGIRVDNGSLSFLVGQITGHTEIGLDLDNVAVAGRSNVAISNVAIVGGEIGIRVRGFDRNTILTLVDATVRDQTLASLQFTGAELFDTIGHSRLSVLSGFAIDDLRTVITPIAAFVVVTGVTLNGNDYSDQLLQGPLSIGSDIRITSADAQWLFREQ